LVDHELLIVELDHLAIFRDLTVERPEQLPAKSFTFDPPIGEIKQLLCMREEPYFLLNLVENAYEVRSLDCNELIERRQHEVKKLIKEIAPDQFLIYSERHE